MDARARAMALALLGVGCQIAKADQAAVRPPPAEPAPPVMSSAAPAAAADPTMPVPAGESAAVPATEAPKEDPPPAPVSPHIGECSDADKGKRLVRFTLAHLNDMQARYSDRIAGRSRYAYVAGYLRALKVEQPRTLVLDAGDDYEKGAVAELRSQGETTRRMIQALPIDVRTIGNHDFAYGEEAVLRDIRLSKHPVLAANVRHSGRGDDDQPLRAFVRVDVGCVRVGVIGLVTQNYGADDQPSKEPFDGVFAQDTHYLDVLEREIKKHRSEVDVIVALTHTGYWQDMALAASPRAKGLDLVVGGHTEHLLAAPMPVVRADGGRTFVVQAGHFAEKIGRADLVFDRVTQKVSFEHYKIVDVDGTLPVADDVADLAEHLEEEAAPDAHRPIGRTQAPVKAGKEMVELAFRAAKDVWGADALLLGRDAFWTGLPRGDVTLQRLYDAVLVQREPAGTSGFSSLWTVTLSGAELKALRARFRPGTYELLAPRDVDPARTYRLVLDKRAMTYPRALFGDSVRLPTGKLSGEIIDLLEAHARAQTARGKPID